MPHFTLTIDAEGPVIDLAIAVGATWRQQSANPGMAAPTPMIVRALIDTGADLTAVHPQILQQLKVMATRSVRVRRPGHGTNFHLAWLSDVDVSLGGIGIGSPWIPAKVIGVSPSTPTVLALIGRDILGHCTLFYNGPRGELTLSC